MMNYMRINKNQKITFNDRHTELSDNLICDFENRKTDTRYVVCVCGDKLIVCVSIMTTVDFDDGTWVMVKKKS